MLIEKMLIEDTDTIGILTNTLGHFGLERESKADTGQVSASDDAKHTLGLTLTAGLATGFRNPSGDRFDNGSVPLTRSEVVRAVVVLLSGSRATAIEKRAGEMRVVATIDGRRRCCCGPEWKRETSTSAASRAIFQISAEVLGGLGRWLTTPKRLRVHVLAQDWPVRLNVRLA